MSDENEDINENEDKSENEDESENEDKSENEDIDDEESKANKSGNEDGSQANKSENSNEENSDNDEKEKEAENNELGIKFDNTKLKLTNEIKIDLNLKNVNIEKDLFMTGVNLKLENKTKTAIKMLCEINSNLDELFEDLSKSIKTFKPENKISEIYTNPIPKNKISNKKLTSPRNYMNDEDYASDFSDRELINQIKNSNNQKVYTNKQTNTQDVVTRSRGNNPINSPNKNTPKHIDPSNNKENNLRESKNKYTPTNPYTTRNTNNHMRTVEDLYKHNTVKPIIYSNHMSNTGRDNKKDPMSKKYFEGEAETYNKEYMRNSMGEGKKIRQVKDIGQAIDILLNNN